MNPVILAHRPRQILQGARMTMDLQPIATAPKDGTYILLFADSGYTTTPLRCEVGHYDAEYRPSQPWVTHSNDSFTDGGEPPQWWAPLPVTPDPQRDLREALIAEMRPLTNNSGHWEHWPGLWRFAEAAIHVMERLGLLK